MNSNGLSKELLSKYRELVYERYGIHFEGEKIDILEIKLLKLAAFRNFSLDEFYERLASGDKATVDEFLDQITVGHTFFFREEKHLSHLVDDMRRKRISNPLVWCAASSTGEEPYSIAITLLESGMNDFLILSSDVNASALRAMHEGVYNASQFQNTPPALLHKYFRKRDAYSWAVRTGLRDYLRIKRLNLHADIQFEKSFDYIFCRNVMIYFDEEGRQKVLETLAKNLRPGGLLFVGHAEAMLTLPRGLRKEAPAVIRKME